MDSSELKGTANSSRNTSLLSPTNTISGRAEVIRIFWGADCLWPCIHLGHHISEPSRKMSMTESSAVHYYVAKCNDLVKELLDRHSKCVMLLVLVRSKGSSLISPACKVGRAALIIKDSCPAGRPWTILDQTYMHSKTSMHSELAQVVIPMFPLGLRLDGFGGPW